MMLTRVSLLIALVAGFASADENKPSRKSIVFSKEKGFKCSGGGSPMESMDESCEGGMKLKFAASVKPEELVWKLAEEVQDHFQQNFAPDTELLVPPENVMDELMAAEAWSQSSTRLDGMSKTVEFGGVASMEYGCKITYGFKLGKIFKETECGFKGKHSDGKKSEGGFGELSSFSSTW